MVDHCLMNCGWDRLPIALVTRIESGTLISTTSASRGEIQNIIDSTPMIVSSEVSSWLMDCCRVWAMLSMSLVARERISPRGWVSK